MCTHLRSYPFSVTVTINSNQVILRHMVWLTYRCFLPDLTGFIRYHCAEPNLQRHLLRADLKKQDLL